MGKYIVIKDANYASNKVKTVTLQELPLYEDITDKLVQGFVTLNSKIYSAYHAESQVITKYCFALEDTDYFLNDCQDVEYYIPSTLKITRWVAQGTNAINSNNTLGTGVYKRSGTIVHGTDSWITADDIYEAVSETAETYQLCGINITKDESTDITPAQMIEMGVKIRRKIHE